MNLDVTAETAIARPRRDVAAYVFDNGNDPIWIGGISESELQREPPFGWDRASVAWPVR